MEAVQTAASWLPADHPDDERTLLSTLGSTWDDYQWFGMGTWFAPVTESQPPMVSWEHVVGRAGGLAL